MRQTFDILDQEAVKELMQIGKVKKTESGEKYLLIEEIEEIQEKQAQDKKNRCKSQFFGINHLIHVYRAKMYTNNRR